MSFAPGSSRRGEDVRKDREAEDAGRRNDYGYSSSSNPYAHASHRSGRAESEAQYHQQRRSYDAEPQRYRLQSPRKYRREEENDAGWGGRSRDERSTRPYDGDSQSRMHTSSREYANQGYGSSYHHRDINHHRDPNASDREDSRSSYRPRSPARSMASRYSSRTEDTLDYGQSGFEGERYGADRRRQNETVSGRSSSPHGRDTDARFSGLSPRSGRHSERHIDKDGWKSRASDSHQRWTGEGSEQWRNRKGANGQYDSPPVRPLKRKVSPSSDDRVPRGQDAQERTAMIDTGKSNNSSTYEPPTALTTGNETTSSDFRHSQVESAAPTSVYPARGNPLPPSQKVHPAAPGVVHEPQASMIERTAPWPFEEVDQIGSRARRVRKKDRPATKPLRDRRFLGCSSIDQYDLGVKLGQGTFGEVKKATHFLTGAEVALKKVTIHEEKDGMPITAIREIKLLKRLHHPAIVPIIDMAYHAPNERGKMGEVYMVEPYMDHDLNGMLENPSIALNMSQIKLYMKQLFEGTLYLHQNNILHRDMKAANLLINNKGQLQIADFGLARPYRDPGRAWESKGWKGGSQSYTGMVVTRWYRPPELLAGERKYGPPIDMWGLGCILAEMIIKQPIFKGSSEIDQMLLISKLCGSPNETTYPGWNFLPGVKNADPSGRPDQEPDVPGQHDFGNYPRRVIEHFTSGGIVVGSDLADLIDKLLVLDPRKRFTAQEALEHKWFWQSPFPADPNSMPKYQASKELDRQRRDQQKRIAQQQQQQQQQRYAPPQAQMHIRQNPNGVSAGSTGQQQYANGPSNGQARSYGNGGYANARYGQAHGPNGGGHYSSRPPPPQTQQYSQGPPRGAYGAGLPQRPQGENGSAQKHSYSSNPYVNL